MTGSPKVGQGGWLGDWPRATVPVRGPVRLAPCDWPRAIGPVRLAPCDWPRATVRLAKVAASAYFVARLSAALSRLRNDETISRQSHGKDWPSAAARHPQDQPLRAGRKQRPRRH